MRKRSQNTRRTIHYLPEICAAQTQNVIRCEAITTVVLQQCLDSKFPRLMSYKKARVHGRSQARKMPQSEWATMREKSMGQQN